MENEVHTPEQARQDAEQGAAERRAGRRVIARLADELLPVLIARLESSELSELEVREDGWRVRLRRSTQFNGAVPTDEPITTIRVGDGPRTAGAAAATGGQDNRPPARTERSRTQVTAPAVGYFVPRDGVSVGASLRSGDVIGYIDVLGVRQEIVVPTDAILARMEVEPGQAVEYGQLVARLEPDVRESRG